MPTESSSASARAAFAGAPFSVDDLVEAFALHDESVEGGRGRSDSGDSGHLGWGEAAFLDGYVKLYMASGDAAWLDKVVDHADRVFAHRSDCLGDGRLTWVTDTYSVAWLEAGPLHNRGTGSLEVRESRIWKTRGGAGVGDAELALEVLDGRRYRLCRAGSSVPLHQGTYRSGADIAALRPFSVALTGRHRPGDCYVVRTFAPRPLEYIVHQGQFLYPIARFCELAHQRRDLRGYRSRARHYVDVIHELARQAEPDWLDMGRGAGAYRFSTSPSQRLPNRILPHNQYLSMARAYAVLTAVSRRRLFSERARAMGALFRRNLRRVGAAYEWHYWDWTEAGEPGHSAVEDTSHGNIDICFAVEACRRDLGFRAADMKRFAAALLERMWNGSLELPQLAHRVDGAPGDTRTFRSWIDLCQWEPRVWDVLWALYERFGRPAADAPSLLQGWLRRVEGESR